MTQDLMNYEQMTQLALRGVVRDAIRRVIREDGLPGAHHFYITFLTRYPGVEIDASLAEKYPEEVTIVLEHQYWDLNAYAEEFEVTLKFGGVPKYLKVPYTAVSRFHDPSVGFALQFDPPAEMQDAPPTLARLAPVEVKTAEAETAPAPSLKPGAKKTSPKTGSKTGAKAKAKAKAQTKAQTKAKAKAKTDDKDGSDEKVVSLDAFRKK